MKPIFATIFLMMAAACWTPLHAGDKKSVAYEPTVVTLSGTIVKEKFGDDAAPVNRGKSAWILRLDQRISVPAKVGDEIDLKEENVSEIHLNIDQTKHPVPKKSFGKTHFTATGTLYHSHTTHHLRPIMMQVSTLEPTTS